MSLPQKGQLGTCRGKVNKKQGKWLPPLGGGRCVSSSVLLVVWEAGSSHRQALRKLVREGACGGGGNRWGRPQPPAHRETAGEQCSLWRSPSRTSWGGNGDSRLAPSLPSGWLCYHRPHSHWLEAVLMEGCSRCGCMSLQDVCHRLLPLATVCHHLATVCHHLSPSATTGHHQPPSATT